MPNTRRGLVLIDTINPPFAVVRSLGVNVRNLHANSTASKYAANSKAVAGRAVKYWVTRNCFYIALLNTGWLCPALSLDSGADFLLVLVVISVRLIFTSLEVNFVSVRKTG